VGAGRELSLITLFEEMSVFLGVNTLNLDTKGRMAIPIKYREMLGDTRVVVTVNPKEHCLWLYPESEWREIFRKLSRLPTMDRQNRLLQRLLMGHASELDLDGQGRILLSPELRKYANLEKKVSLVGQAHKFEIWNESTWAKSREEWLTEANDSESELSEQLSEMVF
tara:strand:+ start:1565 stop:2065 length:501 start_codon:yes stop_codon:yes gene_type:complete